MHISVTDGLRFVMSDRDFKFIVTSESHRTQADIDKGALVGVSGTT